MKYKKKPVVVDAIQWNPEDDLFVADVFFPHVKRISDLEDPDHVAFSLMAKLMGNKAYNADHYGYVYTLEGGHLVSPGDWIITGIQGEYYPCKPGIFAETYEIVKEKK